jgi:hypothetical protein
MGRLRDCHGMFTRRYGDRSKTDRVHYAKIINIRLFDTFFAILCDQRFLRSFSGTGTRTEYRFRDETGFVRNQVIQYRHRKITFFSIKNK